jgi:predicted  nucleic acid-binding Zn-ribbon protein
MSKTQIVLWIDEDLKKLLKIKYDNISKKFTQVMQTILEVEDKEYNEEDSNKIETEIALLQNKLKEIKIQKEQQKLNQKTDIVKQEKQHIDSIEDMYMKEYFALPTMEQQQITQDWKKYLVDNKLEMFQMTRVQYWWRFIKNKGVF